MKKPADIASHEIGVGMPSIDQRQVNEILAALRQVHFRSTGEIPLHAPVFSGNEWKYIRNCLDSTFVSSVGRYVDKFEEMLETFTGVKKAVAVVNGTAALHVALRVCGIEPGDEVIVPALTFVATANVVSYLGAAPHFADSEETTLGIDPDKLEDYLSAISEVREDGCYNLKTGRRIRAVVPMHTFGHPVDLDRLRSVCRRFYIIMVEDAAEALGSFYRGKHVGHWGTCAILSFNGNKTLTTGGGGAVLTNDDQLGQLLKHLTTTARIPHKWNYDHDQIGYNYRMPNLNAALGCAQLEQLPDFLKKKRDLAKRYAGVFQEIDGVRFFVEPDFAKSNYWLNAILLSKSSTRQRDAILETTNENGIMTRPAWTLMHRLPMFEGAPRMDLSVSENIQARLINIPSSAI